MTTPALPDDVRDLLAAVLEAIDLPHPATIGGAEAHDRLLNTRVVHARIALRNLLDDGPALGPAWTASYLRERLAEHPIAGYVTVDQADAALNAGATWSEAVALPAHDAERGERP
ncbi:hypothetical protein [Streptomyces sp. NPDC088766]|uniref:hypothetical protein n=1 Tax=Streptomyces sp. NPDC088766 TaxID=3365893 RepID=UPI0037FBF268